MTGDEARRIAVNIGKLPVLLGPELDFQDYEFCALIVSDRATVTASPVTLFSTAYIGIPRVPVEDADAIEIKAEWSWPSGVPKRPQS
jgi:hypothetical protein